MQLSHTLQQQLELCPLQAEQELVVAYSGGLDSHALLYSLFTLREQGLIANPISAIHIHHGLSPNADAWLRHCQLTCCTLDIKFTGVKVSLAMDSGQSLEALAREARYQKLLELAPQNSIILLAQHQDDQLETFLLQLKRGAGPKGLAAMAPFSTKSVGEHNKQVSLLRPFLAVSKESILAVALRQQLCWVEDESNQNTDFERNFLRQKIIPGLKQRWPEIAKTVSRSARLCAEQQSLLDEVAKQKLHTICRANNSLSVAALKQLSLPWFYQVIRQWLDEQGIQSPSQSILQKLKPELIEAKEDATPIIQWGNWQFRRFNQHLYVLAVVPDILPHTLLWQNQTSMALPPPLGRLIQVPYQADVISASELLFEPGVGELNIHFGGFAQRFTPIDSPHSKPLKQWYKEWKIPPWQRDKIALVTQNNRAVAVLVNGSWRLAKRQSDNESSVPDSSVPERSSLLVLRYEI